MTVAPSVCTTPILDGLEPMPKESRRVRAFDVLGFAAIISMTSFVILLGQLRLATPSLFESGQPEKFAELILAVWLTIALHEIGHVVAGLLAGMTFFRITIPPLSFGRDASEQRFRGSLCITQPMTVMAPGRTTPRRWETALFGLGGPLANLCTCALALWLVGTFSTHILPNRQSLFASGLTFTFMLAATSYVVGTLNLIPLTQQRL